MSELAAYVIGELLCYLLFYRTASALVPIITGDRVAIEEWDENQVEIKKGRFGLAAKSNGQWVLNSGLGILIGVIIWFIIVTGLITIFL